MSIVRSVAAAGALIFGFLAPAFAQTTGQVVGLVADATGAGVPAVAVTATGAQLPGSLMVLTDGAGRYALFTLPPGTYTLQAVLTGFQTTKQSDITVAPGQTTTVNFKLLAGETATASGTSGSAPTSIDVRGTERAFTVSGDGLGDLPSPRDLTAVTRVGALPHLDVIRIDGVHMTPAFGPPLFPAARLEFLDAAVVADGRLSAESAGSGALDVITRSGGNAFRGDVFAFGTGKGLVADNATQTRLPRTVTQIDDVRRDVDVGATAGGAIAKDKAWVFGGYDERRARLKQTVIRATFGGPAVGTRVPLDTTQRAVTAKLTLGFKTHQRLTGSFNADPATEDGPLFPIAGPASTWEGTLKTTGGTGAVRYDALLGNRLMFEALFAHRRQAVTYDGAGTRLASVFDQTSNPVAVSGGFPFFQNRRLDSDEGTLKISKAIHSHVIQAGLQYERLDARVTSFSGGAGQQIDKRLTPGGIVYYDHRYFGPAAGIPAPSLTLEPIESETAVYVQDSWNVGSHLAFVGGARWSRQDATGGSAPIAITDNWAGRLGAVFSTGGGKAKILGHIGRFFDPLPLELALHAFGSESFCRCANFSLTDPSPRADTAEPFTRFFGGLARVDPDLRGQFSDEYAVGYERELVPAVVLSGRYTHRALGRAIEDIRGPAGQVTIVNPSASSAGKTLSFLDGSTVAAPKPRRVSHRVEASARRTFSGRWQLFATYAWSRLEGNYEGPGQAFLAPSVMNLTPAFDYGDLLVNNDGRLADDRPHTIKVDASYVINREGRLNGLTIGVSGLSMSGTPQTAYGYSSAYQSWSYFLVPRGDLGRSPGTHVLDLHVGYPLRIGAHAALQVTGDLFNLFNRQSITTFDQRYNLSSNAPCAGIPATLCNGDGGLLHKGASLTPIDQLVGTAAALNPDFFLTGVRFTAPFSARLGIRLRF